MLTYERLMQHGSHQSFDRSTSIPQLLNSQSDPIQVFFGPRIGWYRKDFNEHQVLAAVQAFEQCNKRMFIHACLSSHLASQNMTRLKNDDPCHRRAKRDCDGCYDDVTVHECTRMALEKELSYIHQFRAASVIHPGSGTGTQREICETFAERLNDIEIPSSHFGMKPLLLENSAGKGKSIGRSWEEFRWIFEALDDTSNISICIDTCHIYDAGENMLDTSESVIRMFDTAYDLLGHNIPMIHLNGSKNQSSPGNPCRQDRHACLMNYGTAFFERTRKKQKVIVEESVADYIWGNPHYGSIELGAMRCLMQGDAKLRGLYPLLKEARNFEGLESIVRQCKDRGTDMISETGNGRLDNIIVSCIANNME